MQQLCGVRPRETLGQGMGPLTARAHYLRRALGDHFRLEENLIEVLPQATLQMLFGREAAIGHQRATDTWRQRAQMLEALRPQLRFDVWRESSLRNDHCFDAIISAYGAFVWAVEGWVVPEAFQSLSRVDGWIWFPKQNVSREQGEEQGLLGM